MRLISPQIRPSHTLVALAGFLVVHVAVVSCQSALEENGIEVSLNVSTEKRTAEFKCTVKGLGRRKIIWRRLSDPYPISVGSARFHPNTRYRVKASGDSATMVIRRIRRADSAEYMCEASNGGPRDTVILNMQGGDNTYLMATPTKVVATLGETVVLPCHVENIGNHMVLWKNERGEVVSLRKRWLYSDRRFRIIHDTYEQWSLQVKNVQDTDVGFFTCVVNTNPVLTRTVELQSSEPAKFQPVLMADESFKRKLEVDAGETVTLTCNFKAYPPAEVKWYKRLTDPSSGKVVRNEVGKGNTFILKSVSVSEAGDYVCIGNNGMGRPSRGKTRLIVKVPTTTVPPTTTTTQFVPTGPAAPKLYHVTRHVKQRRGQGAVLECIGVGQPRPRLEWSVHGHKIDKNYKFNLVPGMEGPHRSTLTLEVRSLISRDFADYKCTGHNQLGLVSIDFKLSELR